MRWTKEESEKAIRLLIEGNDFKEISELLNRTNKSIKEKLNSLGYRQSDYIKREYHTHKNCEHCNINFKSLISENRKFCSKSCSTTFNNLLKDSKTDLKNIIRRDYYNKRKNNLCLNCDIITTNKYCSQKCQHEYKRKEIFKLIESGDTSVTSKMVKQYLIHIHGEKCMECGWCSINLTSNKVPIELEHIDGNSENNSLDNLKLLCPNCHSLTSTYKALNKGNGRHNRMVRYNNGKSY